MRRRGVAVVLLPWIGAGCAALTGLGDYTVDDDAGADAEADAVVDATPTGDVVIGEAESGPPIPVGCGNGRKGGSEACDDGNTLPYDGCSTTCTLEPQCAGGPCTAVCGDGFKIAPEACDDGNTTAGDGCSATCTVESGFICTDETVTPDTLSLPIIYRDMRYRTSPNGHPDFQIDTTAEQGLVQSKLDSSPPYGKPVFAKPGVSLSTAAAFCWWYREAGCEGAGSANPFAKTVSFDTMGKPTALGLTPMPPNAYQYTNTSFFPVDGLGWNVNDGGEAAACPGLSGTHNFSFTSELHYAFTYRGGERLEFTGDDDIWVFVNGTLALDLGGVHPPKSGAALLTAGFAATLGMTVGNVYDIAVFQAERHTCGSAYTLQLSNFKRTRTRCTPQ